MEINSGITIVGNGNIAWSLGYIFRNAGISINMVVGRNKKNIDELSSFLNVKGTDNFSDIPSDSSLILLCISDNALPEVVLRLSGLDIPVAHTAASIPLSVFEKKNTMTGIFYPFQTFTKGILPDLNKSFPLCIEASCQKMLDLLDSFARRITDRVVLLNSEERKKLHLAGILVNNFSNYLITRAYGFLKENSIDPRLLVPLMDETMRKVHFCDPETAQTGPAVRGSQSVIEDHLNMLTEHPDLRELYLMMSKGINNYFNK